MKTDDLINMLASGVTPIDRHAPTKRVGVAMLIGSLSATILVMIILGARPDLGIAATTPIFWAKVAFPLTLMVGALSLVMRLARPGRTLGPGTLLIVAGVTILWAGSLYVLLTATPDMRATLVLGKTWRVCAMNITLLSIPGLLAAFWAMRGLAPTRLTLTGACVGLLAGATATLAYCLHCPEMDVPFWGTWYWLGMVIPTVIGALLGRRWLRW